MAFSANDAKAIIKTADIERLASFPLAKVQERVEENRIRPPNNRYTSSISYTYMVREFRQRNINTEDLVSYFKKLGYTVQHKMDNGYGEDNPAVRFQLDW